MSVIRSLQHTPKTKTVGRRRLPWGLSSGQTRSVIHGPQEALALVADKLAQCESEIQGQLMSEVAALSEVSQYLVRAGGKRLRPTLSAFGARVLGDAPNPKLMCAGELIHLGSLLHDDVVDLGVTRRGQPVTQSVYGNAAAILGGDYCIARATLISAEQGNVELSHRLAQVLTAMAEGEMLQLNRAADLTTTREAYYEVIERKAAVLIAWCASSHAWVAGRHDEARALEAYGRSVGMGLSDHRRCAGLPGRYRQKVRRGPSRTEGDVASAACVGPHPKFARTTRRSCPHRQRGGATAK